MACNMDEYMSIVYTYIVRNFGEVFNLAFDEFSGSHQIIYAQSYFMYTGSIQNHKVKFSPIATLMVDSLNVMLVKVSRYMELKGAVYRE